ncbi:VQ motif-containing protein 11-like [Malania oleifera]|uniref:VQ motif-containing protein 11-like n=1 Tax=Malania oleifera TaxID=397392 RepID=UPI0025AE12D9|nr:VQ motif-containing protein 11-like [Malania oleifera]
MPLLIVDSVSLEAFLQSLFLLLSVSSLSISLSVFSVSVSLLSVFSLMASNNAANKLPAIPCYDSSNTTFVQADPSTFRAVVQRLTGAAADDPSAERLPVTVPARHAAAKPAAGEMGPRRPPFKLHERRQSVRNLEIKHRSFLGFGGGETVMASPVSPFDAFSGAGGSPKTPSEEEERAIAEKGFYLHPISPLNTPRGSEPALLPLFPLQSPRQIDDHSS